MGSWDVIVSLFVCYRGEPHHRARKPKLSVVFFVSSRGTVDGNQKSGDHSAVEGSW